MCSKKRSINTSSSSSIIDTSLYFFWQSGKPGAVPGNSCRTARLPEKLSCILSLLIRSLIALCVPKKKPTDISNSSSIIDTSLYFFWQSGKLGAFPGNSCRTARLPEKLSCILSSLLICTPYSIMNFNKKPTDISNPSLIIIIFYI